jgi:hypothetical protein
MARGGKAAFDGGEEIGGVRKHTGSTLGGKTRSKRPGPRSGGKSRR